MACLSTLKTSDQLTQVWFDAAMYNFDYFQATDKHHSADDKKM